MSTYNSGSTPLLPSVCRKLPATTGVGTMNGRAATNPRAGRTPRLRLTPRINSTAARTLSSTSGVFRTAMEGRAIQKNGAMIHDCTPSM